MIATVFIPLFATFIGAFLAFRYQYSIEKRRDKRGVVQVLMMYRNVAADELEWIKHMNVIDIVFHDNERVRQLFDQYMYWVDDYRFHTGNHVKVYYEMLYLMCQDCGYSQIVEYDLKRNVYSPNALRDHYNRRLNEFVFVQGPIDQELAILYEDICQLGIA